MALIQKSHLYSQNNPHMNIVINLEIFEKFPPSENN